MDIAAPLPIRKLDECAILLDVDGTILDLAPTPPQVWVPPSLRQAIGRLSERTGGAVALVSGRSLDELDLLFSPLQLPAVGGHGAELRPQAGRGHDYRRAVPLDAALKRKFAKVAELDPGILLEDKDYSLALHFRLAPDLEDRVKAAVERICAELTPVPIEILHGKSVLRRYSDAISTASSSTTSQKPFSSRPDKSRQKIGSPSKFGKHHHTIRDVGSMSAAVRPLPMTARSRP